MANQGTNTTQLSAVNYCASSSWGYAGSVTGFENIENQSAAHKVLRNGQVVILREGKTYSILGTRID